MEILGNFSQCLDIMHYLTTDRFLKSPLPVCVRTIHIRQFLLIISLYHKFIS